MYYFINDYSEGMHPVILDILRNKNTKYEEPNESIKRAKNIIKSIVNKESAKIYFTSNSTQANLIVLNAFLGHDESVLLSDLSQIVELEKSVSLISRCICISSHSNEGKIIANDIKNAYNDYSHIHNEKPRLVYISNATERGTVYNITELKLLYHTCKELDLFLYINGTRLSNALVCTNIQLSNIGELCDAFTIGGTKNGAMMGEAIIVLNPMLQENLERISDLLCENWENEWILGIQFEALMQNNLYLELAKHANMMADKLRIAIKERGYNFSINSTTNQIFPILPNELLKKLSNNYSWNKIRTIDNKYTEISLITSWATTEQAVNSFINAIN